MYGGSARVVTDVVQQVSGVRIVRIYLSSIIEGKEVVLKLVTL